MVMMTVDSVANVKDVMWILKRKRKGRRREIPTACQVLTLSISRHVQALERGGVPFEVHY